MKRRHLGRQRGVYFIVYAITLPFMLAMVGLALDLSMLYARGRELQAIADSTALAAARQLNGTRAGIDAARSAAKATGKMNRIRFLNSETVDWDGAALRLSDQANGGSWVDADAVPDSLVPSMRYAMVDTGQLDDDYGKVAISFMRVVGQPASVTQRRVAVAGRRDSLLAPLAVCAMNPNQYAGRGNGVGNEELLEYGFRRGVGYNLLNLSPASTSAQSFVVNPVDFAPAPNRSNHMATEFIAPFTCSGTMPAPPLASGSSVYVSAPFPAGLAREWNSRFGQYSGSACDSLQSPPDGNVIDFSSGYSGFYMGSGSTPLPGSPLPHLAGLRLTNIADASGAVPGSSATSYGPLWSFARPLRYNSASGNIGNEFSRSHWAALYPVAVGLPPSSSYTLQKTPYLFGGTPHRLNAPSTGVSGRRVLNVALLRCPVSGASAVVLGIGRFFMTTAATSVPAALHAEFGGLVLNGAPAANVVLVQ